MNQRFIVLVHIFLSTLLYKHETDKDPKGILSKNTDSSENRDRNKEEKGRRKVGVSGETWERNFRK